MGGNEEEQRNNRCAWLSIALANARLQWLSRFYDHYTSYFLRALKPRALLTTSIVLIPPPRQAGVINSKRPASLSAFGIDHKDGGERLQNLTCLKSSFQANSLTTLHVT